jgi:hypothetical protein
MDALFADDPTPVLPCVRRQVPDDLQLPPQIERDSLLNRTHLIIGWFQQAGSFSGSCDFCPRVWFADDPNLHQPGAGLGPGHGYRLPQKDYPGRTLGLNLM